MTEPHSEPDGGDGRPQIRAGVAPDGQWHRVHPLTPAVRSWQILAVVMVLLAQEVGQSAVSGNGLGEDGSGGGPDLSQFSGWLLAGTGAVLALVLAIGVGAAVLTWRSTRWRVTADALELHHGVLFRRQRRARLDRLQAVDVVQPLVARIFGLAKLTLEVAGGSDSKIELAFLTETQAQQLRAHLLARAAGVHYETEQAPVAPEHPVLEVPVPRLVVSLLLSAATGSVLVIVAVLVLVALFAGTLAPAAAVLPVALAAGGLLWRRFTGGFGFRVATSPDGLRLRHGLLEQRAQTVPPGRVQAVRISQPLLWRIPGWYRVHVNVAGYGRAGEHSEDSESTMLPVGNRDEAITMLALVLPDLGVEDDEQARSVVDAGLTGSGAGHGFVGSPRNARWLDPLAWRRNGFRVTGEALLMRRGWIQRHFDVVPHARTQSCGVTQGPWQRRLGLASFALHSTPGPIAPVVPHLSGAVAAALLAEQSDRARRARAQAAPHEWMRSSAQAAPTSAAADQSPASPADPAGPIA